MSSGGGDVPNPPDYAKLYQSGLDVFLRNLPRVTETETQYREALDPLRIAEQQALQDQFGPNQIRQQRDALDQFDPNYLNTRELLRTNVTNDLLAGGNPATNAVYQEMQRRVLGDLQSGYNLPADYARELEQSTRGAQTARGNAYGTGPALSESAFKGKAALDLYQQHLANAGNFLTQKSPEQLARENVGNFLAGPTPEQQALAIQAVQPDRGMAYASPAAGTQGANFGLSNYQNLLAQQQLVGSQRNPWASAATGALGGAATGAAFGPYGALIGAAVGGGVGYFGSDENIKERILYTGETHRGVRIAEFNYKGDARRFRGVIAQEVETLFPNFVKAFNGIKFVNYRALGLTMQLV
jgi:hypothetical protein